MNNKKYFFQPEKKILKQGFFMTDENGNVVYEAKVLKQSLLGPATVEFINHISGKKQEHQVGKVVTTETSGMFEFFSVKSWFKLDGKKIWDYLHAAGIRINSSMADGKIGMTYDISLKGEPIATLATAAANGGKAIITSGFHYDVTSAEENLDWAFLTTFAIAKTEQAFYD